MRQIVTAGNLALHERNRTLVLTVDPGHRRRLLLMLVAWMVGALCLVAAFVPLMMPPTEPAIIALCFGSMVLGCGSWIAGYRLQGQPRTQQPILTIDRPGQVTWISTDTQQTIIDVSVHLGRTSSCLQFRGPERTRAAGWAAPWDDCAPMTRIINARLTQGQAGLASAL